MVFACSLFTYSLVPYSTIWHKVGIDFGPQEVTFTFPYYPLPQTESNSLTDGQKSSSKKTEDEENINNHKPCRTTEQTARS